MIKLKSILLLFLFVSPAYADLDKAVDLAEQEDLTKKFGNNENMLFW